MSRKEPTIVALIPARSGSKRVPGKNVRILAGHPLIAYTISAALESGIFARVLVSTDSPEVADLAVSYGAEAPFLRPPHMADDKSPDIDWVRFTLERLAQDGEFPDSFSILRPTSPFRLSTTIHRAWEKFLSVDVDSLRAVELCKQHPGKMWVRNGELIQPLLDDGGVSPPWHSTPYQALPTVYAQNASLEIAWSRVPSEYRTIAGLRITPFFTQGMEGFDINGHEDWILAEALISRQLAHLPVVRRCVDPKQFSTDSSEK